MKGRILDYSRQQSKGVIAGEDGRHYRFSADQWHSPSLPSRAALVDFQAEQDRACDIYRLDNGMPPRVAAALFAFFIGVLGIHKFYLGNNKAGLIMLLVWLIGLLLLGIPSMLIWLLGIIEGIIYLTRSDAEFEQTYIIDKKAWF